MARGKLIVVSAPSGCGKGTILGRVLEDRERFYYSVSATTRNPRPGEVEGESYYFVTKEKFQEMIDRNEFVEYDAHMDNYYGTPRQQLEEKLVDGHVILDIEPNGAFSVRKAWPEACLIFIAPPSREELERRLRGRGDTSEDQIGIRMARANWEMDQSKDYDYIVVNDQVETCADKILKIIAEKAD